MYQPTKDELCSGMPVNNECSSPSLHCHTQMQAKSVETEDSV